MTTQRQAIAAARTKAGAQPVAGAASGARTAAVVIFLLAGAGLAYEVLLTRLFSVVFQYHYVFLIVSLSIAGLSLGAGLATLPRKLNPGRAAVATSALFVVSALVIAAVRSASAFGPILVVSLLPFAGIGYLNAALFARYARFSGALYAADLSGGVLGLLVSLGLVSLLGAFQPVLALAVVVAAVAVVLSRERLTLVWAALVAVAFVGNTLVGVVRFAPETYTDAPPDKTMLQVLQQPGADLLETRWDPFARLDLVGTRDDSQRYVFTDGGAGSTMVRYGGADEDVQWLRRDLAFLPFVGGGEIESALILGAGAGRDVLMAYLAGVGSITAVEINPTLVALTRAHDDYTGGVFDLPGVETVVADARTFVERSDSRYDLIYANLVYSQAAAPTTSALAENYIFTREALSAYWAHLSDGGQIAFVTHNGIEGVRLLLGALDMLETDGLTLQQALDHVGLFTLQGGDAQARTSVVLISRQALTGADSSALAAEAHARRAGALYLPGYIEVGLEPLALGARTLAEYIADNVDFDLTPVTDDRPFFYQFRPGLPAGLSDLLTASLVLLFVYLSWLMFFFIRPADHGRRVSLGVYFTLLGAGYLLVEIPLIQKFQLLLEQPTLALIVVIGGMLTGSALGSLFSGRWTPARLAEVVPRFAAAVAVGAVAAGLAVTPLIQAALPLPLGARIAVALALVMPLGFLMGVMFPGGLRLAALADERGIAAFWGANAAASVVGSAAAMVVAVSLGYTAALAAGAAAYLLAALLARSTWPRLARV